MELLFGGIVLGFVLSTALFIQKIWQLQDRVEHYKIRAKVYRRKCEELYKNNIEWENAKKCESGDLFGKF